jgi:DNA-binding XRE family transcriptional regulator
MTQRQFAQMCGLSVRTIVNAENGEVSKFARAKIEYHMEETDGSINKPN